MKWSSPFVTRGTGIAEHDLPKVFQPFWSSKGVGIGKGMGLAVTHGLVKRHGGSISVDSKVGVGTTFTIRLPLAHGAGQRRRNSLSIEYLWGPSDHSGDRR